jgi:hypothetical protein
MVASNRLTHPDHPATASISTTSVSLEPDSSSSQRSLGEAARFAVLCRVAPMLRHDMAGALQPLGMVAMVLQRRVQASDPDLAAIAKNAASISSLTKDAAAGCIDAISWLAPREDPVVSLHRGVEDVLKVLLVELSGCGLEAVNDIPENSSDAPQGYFRTVLAGALLAFCDEGTGGGKLHIGVLAGQSGPARLVLRLVAAETSVGVASRHKRRIEWPDVQALATSSGTTLERSEDGFTLGLPASRQV